MRRGRQLKWDYDPSAVAFSIPFNKCNVWVERKNQHFIEPTETSTYQSYGKQNWQARHPFSNTHHLKDVNILQTRLLLQSRDKHLASILEDLQWERLDSSTLLGAALMKWTWTKAESSQIPVLKTSEWSGTWLSMLLVRKHSETKDIRTARNFVGSWSRQKAITITYKLHIG